MANGSLALWLHASSDRHCSGMKLFPVRCEGNWDLLQNAMLSQYPAGTGSIMEVEGDANGNLQPFQPANITPGPALHQVCGQGEFVNPIYFSRQHSHTITKEGREALYGSWPVRS